MADRKPITLLTLDDLSDRPVVTINGQPYQLVTRAILPPLHAAKMARWGRRLETLLTKVETIDLTEEEEGELEAIPKLMCPLILQAPEAVLQQLSDHQRMEIIATFMTGPWLMSTTAPLPSPSVPTKSTGASSLPDLSTDTVATH